MQNEQDIYEEHVLDHYEDPYHRGECEGATHAHEADNPLCGDVIHIDLRLSPEGFDLGEMRQLTQTLLADGVRTFTLSFHSPSVEPGYTPYVRDRIQLDRFLGILQDYLDYFVGVLGGRSVTPLEYREELLKLEGRA